MLSAEERERAEKISSAAGRTEFVFAHALIRAVLSQYHPVAPGEWRFARSPLGKPFIRAPAAASPLRFNLSHTRGLAAGVVTLASAAGVDVERIEPHADLLAVAREFLPAAAVRELAALAGAARTIRFYEQWTRLEACAKAGGGGLISPVSPVATAEGWQGWQRRVPPDHLLAAVVPAGHGIATVFTLRQVRWPADANDEWLTVCGLAAEPPGAVGKKI
jgi:4'-phosphopantetheinyl transferase